MMAASIRIFGFPSLSSPTHNHLHLSPPTKLAFRCCSVPGGSSSPEILTSSHKHQVVSLSIQAMSSPSDSASAVAEPTQTISASTSSGAAAEPTRMTSASNGTTSSVGTATLPPSGSGGFRLSMVPIPIPNLPIWAMVAIGGAVILALPNARKILRLEDMAEKIAKLVVKEVKQVAPVVDKVAGELADILPEGSALQQKLEMIEHIAEEIAEGAEMAEDLIEEVDEFTDKIEDFFEEADEEGKDKELSEKNTDAENGQMNGHPKDETVKGKTDTENGQLNEKSKGETVKENGQVEVKGQ